MNPHSSAARLLTVLLLVGCGSVVSGEPDDGGVDGDFDAGPPDALETDADADVPVETEADGDVDSLVEAEAEVDALADVPSDVLDVVDTADATADGGPSLVCDPHFTLEPVVWRTGEPGLVTITDTTPHANFVFSTNDSSRVTTAWLGVDRSPADDYVWTWRVRGHTVGILELSFTSDHMSGSTYDCQVRVDAGAHPELLCDAGFGVQRDGSNVRVEFTDEEAYTNVDLRARGTAGELDVSVVGTAGGAAPYTWSWLVLNHAIETLELELHADPSERLVASCRVWI